MLPVFYFLHCCGELWVPSIYVLIEYWETIDNRIGLQWRQGGWRALLSPAMLVKPSYPPGEVLPPEDMLPCIFVWSILLRVEAPPGNDMNNLQDAKRMPSLIPHPQPARSPQAQPAQPAYPDLFMEAPWSKRRRPGTRRKYFKWIFVSLTPPPRARPDRKGVKVIFLRIHAPP